MKDSLFSLARPCQSPLPQKLPRPRPGSECDGRKYSEHSRRDNKSPTTLVQHLTTHINNMAFPGMPGMGGMGQGGMDEEAMKQQQAIKYVRNHLVNTFPTVSQ